MSRAFIFLFALLTCDSITHTCQYSVLGPWFHLDSCETVRKAIYPNGVFPDGRGTSTGKCVFIDEDHPQ